MKRLQLLLALTTLLTTACAVYAACRSPYPTCGIYGVQTPWDVAWPCCDQRTACARNSAVQVQRLVYMQRLYFRPFTHL